MSQKSPIIPFSLKDAPALIEKLLPAQRLSAESYKEQMAVGGKTLTALGSYWKGRKPLILNKACILGVLLPATRELKRDLEIFEMLMAMDERSLAKRMKLKDQALPAQPYRELIHKADRPEMCGDELHDHIWEEVNTHLGTAAYSMPQLVEQLGLMRFGRRPRLADLFCGSGQIAFEAARLGCDVYASDLNPIACMLTWGAFNIVGASKEQRKELEQSQRILVERVQAEIDQLGIESDGKGARAKVFLYCLETTCPQTGWSVPMIPSLMVSKNHKVIARLIPDPDNKRYGIEIVSNASEEELQKALSSGTVKDGSLEHSVKGKLYRTKISTLRGDYTDAEGVSKNRLRPWDKTDITFRDDDLFRERLYCIQWQYPVTVNGKVKSTTEFRTVTPEDLAREKVAFEYVTKNLEKWQAEGLVPDMVIESGDETDRLLRERGWTHWHHLFNPRQLLLCAFVNEASKAYEKFGFAQLINRCSRLCHWHNNHGSSEGVFYNQALNTFWNYSCRGSLSALPLLEMTTKSFPLLAKLNIIIENRLADQVSEIHDIYITDPPYGDAVKYEEILEFFITWLRKAPPPEFANWTWDSRRALAIKGEDDAFRRGMIAAYSKMREQMPDNGLQIIMFTHQDAAVWANLALILWAAGLQVTAAWTIATETISALKTGNYVQDTVIMVCRKRLSTEVVFLDELQPLLEEEVARQVQQMEELDDAEEPNFGDSDYQLAAYAAALRVLTSFKKIENEQAA